MAVDPFAQLGEVFPLPTRIDDEIACKADAHLLEQFDGAYIVGGLVVLVDRFQTLVIHLLQAHENRQITTILPHLDQLRMAGDDVGPRLDRKVFFDAGLLDEPCHLLAASMVEPENIVGDEDVGNFVGGGVTGKAVRDELGDVFGVCEHIHSSLCWNLHR